jgi:formiminotetrahydrofolate cyclodeaminase
VSPAYKNVTTLTVSAFAEMASSDSAAPGGGAVAGVVAGLAAALAAMAGRFALKHATDPTSFGALVNRADELRSRCCDLADADTRAYAAFAAARQMSTGAGGEQRRLAMQAARGAAAAPPREIADIGLELVTAGNPHLRSDACAAALFASAAARVSAILVDLNISADGTDPGLAQANQHARAAATAAQRALVLTTEVT